MSIVDTLELVGTPETNKVMAGELSRLAVRALGRRPPAPAKRGGALVYPFAADLADLAVRYQRTATRALWGLYRSRASRLEPLYDELLADLAADSRDWLWDGATLSVRARNLAGFAAGERQVVGTVKNAVIDGAAARGIGMRVDPDRPDLLVTVRRDDQEVTVSIDLAGGSLSRRGYRRDGGSAPLREHLAAVLVMLSRYDARREILLDPMCGSGTIAIEAALMARAEPLDPAGARPPAMAAMPCFAGLTPARGPLFADTEAAVVASDLDAVAVKAARANAGRAGVGDRIAIGRADFRDLDRAEVMRRAGPGAPERGVILCNPPYGERLGGGELTRLYRDLAAWCRQFRGWRACFLCANPALERAFPGRPRIRKPLANGPLRGYFSLYEL